MIPSRTEPFGRVPLEAYAAGAAPVVATTAGGLAEQVIDGVTGLTASPADPVSLASAIGRALSLTDDERDRMRCAGRCLARTDSTAAAPSGVSSTSSRRPSRWLDPASRPDPGAIW